MPNTITFSVNPKPWRGRIMAQSWEGEFHNTPGKPMRNVNFPKLFDAIQEEMDLMMEKRSLMGKIRAFFRNRYLGE